MGRVSWVVLVLVALLVVAACAGGDDDAPAATATQPALAATPTQEPAPSPTAEPTPTSSPAVTPTATPEPEPTATASPVPAAATPTPTATPEPSPTATPADTGVTIEPFLDAQEQVDFELWVPVETGGLTLPAGPLEVTGPPTALGVTATFSSQPNGAFRIISLMQRAEGVGLEPDRPDDETETVDIQGVETTLALETRADGTTVYRMAWWMDDTHLTLGATNVDRDTVLAFARSLTPLREVTP